MEVNYMPGYKYPTGPEVDHLHFACPTCWKDRAVCTGEAPWFPVPEPYFRLSGWKFACSSCGTEWLLQKVYPSWAMWGELDIEPVPNIATSMSLGGLT